MNLKEFTIQFQEMGIHQLCFSGNFEWSIKQPIFPLHGVEEKIDNDDFLRLSLKNKGEKFNSKIPVNQIKYISKYRNIDKMFSYSLLKNNKELLIRFLSNVELISMIDKAMRDRLKDYLGLVNIQKMIMVVLPKMLLLL